LCVAADGVNFAEKQYQPAFVAVTAPETPVAEGGVVAVCLVRLTGVPSLLAVAVEQVKAADAVAVKHL
jgi:hypothetical protein